MSVTKFRAIKTHQEFIAKLGPICVRMFDQKIGKPVESHAVHTHLGEVEFLSGRDLINLEIQFSFGDPASGISSIKLG